MTAPAMVRALFSVDVTDDGLEAFFMNTAPEGSVMKITKNDIKVNKLKD